MKKFIALTAIAISLVGCQNDDDEQSPIIQPTAQVITLATTEPGFGDGMTVTPQGDILVCGGGGRDNILKITSEGIVSEYISGLPSPVSLGFDSTGNLYVTNYRDNSISKITPTNTVSTFASGLDGPAGLFVSDNDEIFVTLYGADFSGEGSKVLKFNLDGSFEEYAVGSGIRDAIGVTMDENGNLYVTNFVGGNIYKIDTNRNISTIATIADAFINQITYADNYIYAPSPNLRKIYRVNTNDGSVEHISGTGGDLIVNGDLLEAQFSGPGNCAFNPIGIYSMSLTVVS